MSESLMVAKVMASSLSDSVSVLACDLDSGRAWLTGARSIGHDAFDLARARRGERLEALDQRFVGARARQREAQAPEHRVVAIEDRRADADAAGIDLAVGDADAGAPQRRERVAEIVDVLAEARRR